MVMKYELILTPESENVSDVKLMDWQNPNFRYCFKLECEKCGVVTAKENWVCLKEQVFLAETNRRVHLHQKCRGCEREGTIKMVPIPLQKDPKCLHWDEASSALRVPLMMFECDGFLPLISPFGNLIGE